MNTLDRIVVTCPGCQRQLRGRTDFVGRAVRCKHHDCGMVFEVPAPNPFSLAVPAPQPVAVPPPGRVVRNGPTRPAEQKGPAGRRREWWFAAGGVGLFVLLVVVGVWGYHRGMARTRQDREADRVTPAEKAKEADRLAADLTSARATAERGKATEADREKAVAAGREQAAAVRPSANPKLPAEVKKQPDAAAPSSARPATVKPPPKEMAKDNAEPPPVDRPRNAGGSVTRPAGSRLADKFEGQWAVAELTLFTGPNGDIAGLALDMPHDFPAPPLVTIRALKDRPGGAWSVSGVPDSPGGQAYLGFLPLPKKSEPFDIDERTTPISIDWVTNDNRRFKGILKFDDDNTLVLCVSNKDRPENFEPIGVGNNEYRARLSLKRKR